MPAQSRVMGRFPDETSCLTLVWAVLDLLITHQTNGIHFNQLDRNASSGCATKAPNRRSLRR